MSDKAGDVIMIVGALVAAWGWLKLRALPKGKVTIPSVTMVLPDGTSQTYHAPMEQKPVSSAPFSPELVSSFFMPSMSPQPTQAAAPRVGSFGWANFDDFAARASELDVFARTLFGEAAGEGRRGIEAVAAVIVNRANSRRYPNTVRAVCLQGNQFSMWNVAYRNSDPNSLRALAVTDSNSTFKMCLDIASDALAGRLKDPTDGATMYYAPRGMIPPGSAPKTWNFSVLKKSAEIGNHIFYVEL